MTDCSFQWLDITQKRQKEATGRRRSRYGDLHAGLRSLDRIHSPFEPREVRKKHVGLAVNSSNRGGEHRGGKNANASFRFQAFQKFVLSDRVWWRRSPFAGLRCNPFQGIC